MRTMNAKVLVVGLLAVGLLFATGTPAAADDETGDTDIKLQATLDAVACDTSTISVLGLSIDISTAAIEADGQGGGGGESNDDGQTSDQGGSQTGCAALTAGQTVEVKLASAAAPLTATKIEQKGNQDSIEIQAPIDAAAAPTITVLGQLTIDMSQADVSGAGDDASNDESQPIDLSQLAVGQVVEVKLDPAQLPQLIAREVEVKNFANQVEVEVDDSTGQEVDDVDDNGAPVDDVDVTVTETVRVQNPAAATGGRAAARAPRRLLKTLTFHTRSNGSFKLNGLATGRAKIVVSRVVNGAPANGARTVNVRSNTTRSLRVRLRTVVKR